MAINPINGKVNNGLLTSAAPAKKEKPETMVNNTGNDTMKNQVDVAVVAQGIKQALESAPPTALVDFDKVAQVKEALLTGKFQINADSIAEKILEFDRHLNGT